MIALAAVQTILLVLVFARTLPFDFAMVFHFILCMGLIYGETAATTKNSDIDTTTAFVSNRSQFLKNVMIK